MSNIEKLKKEVYGLLALLEDPQPGLSSWLDAYARRIENIVSFRGGNVSQHAIKADASHPAVSDLCDKCGMPLSIHRCLK